MPSRLQQFNVYPWTGGLVKSIDESLIDPGQLTQADNILFSTQGTRLKRPGINADWDDLEIVSVSRSSSGTSRTITTTGYYWKVGDQFTLSGAGNTNYNTGSNLATVSAVTSTHKSTVTFSNASSSTVTISNASPGVITWNAHGLSNGTGVYLTTTGTLPTGLSPSTVYYVVGATTNTFTLAATVGGTAINTSSAGSGTHTAHTSAGVVSWTSNALNDGDPIIFTTGGSLPSPLISERVYYVSSAATNSFSIKSTPTDTLPIDLLAFGSGTHTAREALEDVATYTFAAAASLSESSTADTTMVITLATKVIALYDFWYGDTSAKTQRLIALYSTGAVYEINPTSGARTLLYDSGTPYEIPAGGIVRGDLIAYNNRIMISVEGQNNVVKHYFPEVVGGSGVIEDVVNTTGYEATPKASFMQVHLGRLFCNDKNNPDRLHYCETGAYNVWQGAGDSGALDIGVGDGDPEGITAIFPPFKGVLITAKRTKLYKVGGQFPETFSIDRMASGLGCIGHKAVAAVDQDDVLFVSDKGIHSSVATDQFGDLNATYVSKDIQTPIIEEWNRSRQKYIQAAYLPQTNSIGFCVAEESDSSQQDVWLYNFTLKQWYRWPNINCTSICTSNDSDKQRFYFGRDDGRVSQSFTDNNFDVTSTGANSAIVMTISTGLIYPDGNILSQKAFKRLALVYKPKGSYTIAASFKIDNFSAQSIVYNSTTGSDLLGSTFILGQSVLGLGQITAAFTQSIDGFGKVFKLTIQQSGVNEFGEILGFIVFYESSEPVYETRLGDES
jgi:hypothetical protein